MQTVHPLMLLAKHKTSNTEIPLILWNPPYLCCSTYNTNLKALQLSSSISYVTIAKWVPIEGQDGMGGGANSTTSQLVEWAKWQMVYFHLLRMLMTLWLCGPWQNGKYYSYRHISPTHSDWQLSTRKRWIDPGRNHLLNWRRNYT